MKLVLAVAMTAAAAVSAHSWVECVHHENAEILEWMKGNATLDPPVQVDPTEPRYAHYCKGWPRSKANPGNWIEESGNYYWDIISSVFDGGPSHPPDTSACHPSQRSPVQMENAPMATVAPGSMFRLRYGGNGHSRGHALGTVNGDPGNVSVYWKGKPEQEITDISEFREENLLTRSGFSTNSFAYPADMSVTEPPAMIDKGNFLEVTLPLNTPPGRHMMVWVWDYLGENRWTTCFDVFVAGGGYVHAVVPDGVIKRGHPRHFH